MERIVTWLIYPLPKTDNKSIRRLYWVLIKKANNKEQAFEEIKEMKAKNIGAVKFFVGNKKICLNDFFMENVNNR